MNWFLPGLLALALSGCGKPATDASFHPEVVQVRFAGGRGLCTGTIVGPRTILTASHCVNPDDSFSVQTARGDFRTRNVVVPEGVTDRTGDLALLVFEETIADDADIMAFGTNVLQGDTVEITGYGCDEIKASAPGAYQKRAGRNTIRRVYDFIEVATPIEDATQPFRGIIGRSDAAGGCPGDSGGPATHQDKKSGQHFLVGVTNAIAVRDTEVLSLFVDINRPENRDFLRRANQTHSLSLRGI